MCTYGYEVSYSPLRVARSIEMKFYSKIIVSGYLITHYTMKTYCCGSIDSCILATPLDGGELSVLHPDHMNLPGERALCTQWRLDALDTVESKVRCAVHPIVWPL
jgi:hypothetical protein